MSKLVILVVEATSDAWDESVRRSAQGLWMAGTLEQHLEELTQALGSAIIEEYELDEYSTLTLTVLNVLVYDNHLSGIQDESSSVPPSVQDAAY